MRTFLVVDRCKHFWATVLDDESVLEIHARLCRPLHQDCWECKRLNVSINNLVCLTLVELLEILYDIGCFVGYRT